MSNRALSLPSAFALILLLASCGSSPPNNYYLLSAHDTPVAVGNTPSVGVGPIEVPEYLSREGMVYNRADNTLQVASVDLWAEPLVNGIQRVMVLNLTGLLNTQDVRFFPWHPKRAPAYGVKVNLLQLEATGQQVLLAAEWLLYRPGSAEQIERRISRLQSPLTGDNPEAEQVAAAYSELLYQLSEIIAAAITSDQSSTAP